jgi:hypothetical protein
MNGYVQNKTTVWRHAMKRTIGPGHKVALDDLFKQYGAKHELEAGAPFVEWLRNVKLRDGSIWEVVYDETSPEQAVEATPEYEVKELVNTMDKTNLVVPFVKKPIEPKDIVNMTVRDARDKLKKITDLDLLKYAYNEVRQLSNKDTLARMLMIRIKDLEISRR